MNQTVVQTNCFHCNSPIEEDHPVFTEKNGIKREYCCNGCATVSSLLLENGLDQFYQIRGTQVLEPKEPENENYESDSRMDNPSVHSEYVEVISENRSAVFVTIRGIIVPPVFG